MECIHFDLWICIQLQLWTIYKGFPSATLLLQIGTVLHLDYMGLEFVKSRHLDKSELFFLQTAHDIFLTQTALNHQPWLQRCHPFQQAPASNLSGQSNMTFGSVNLIKFLTLRGDSLYWSNLPGFNKGALGSFASSGSVVCDRRASGGAAQSLTRHAWCSSQWHWPT